jgi:RHS repeat-associated protein
MKKMHRFAISLITFKANTAAMSTHSGAIKGCESYHDYYPFGMEMPGRSHEAGGYRFGFNGKEADPEAVAAGSQYDYGFRIYNTGIGRFLSVDPITASYPWYTPYQFAGNKPINSIDLDGLEEFIVIYSVDNEGKMDNGICLMKTGSEETPIISRTIIYKPFINEVEILTNIPSQYIASRQFSQMMTRSQYRKFMRAFRQAQSQGTTFDQIKYFEELYSQETRKLRKATRLQKFFLSFQSEINDLIAIFAHASRHTLGSSENEVYTVGEEHQDPLSGYEVVDEKTGKIFDSSQPSTEDPDSEKGMKHYPKRYKIVTDWPNLKTWEPEGDTLIRDEDTTEYKKKIDPLHRKSE